MGRFPYVLPGWLVDPYPPVVVNWKTWDLCRKFQFIGNCKATQYFVNFQWLEFHFKILGMAGKQCVSSTQKAGERSLLSETLAGISTLTQWTP